MSNSLSSAERTKLKDYIIEYFNRDELEDIMFDLGIPKGSFGESIPNRKFVRELIDFCKRRDSIDCLLIEVTRRRNNAHTILGDIIAKFNHCSPRKKVQVILDEEKLNITLGQLKKMIAGVCSNISEEDVVIISAARGSVRLLLSIPEIGLNQLLSSIDTIKNELPIHSIIEFKLLSVKEQKTWRYVSATYPFHYTQALKIKANWDEASIAVQNRIRERITILLKVPNLLSLMDDTWLPKPNNMPSLNLGMVS